MAKASANVTFSKYQGLGNDFILVRPPPNLNDVFLMIPVSTPWW